MASLGIVILWAGYTFGIFGFSKIKSAYGAAPALSLSDLALPSHRATYIAAVQQWGNPTPSSGAVGAVGTESNPAPGSPAATGTGKSPAAPLTAPSGPSKSQGSAPYGVAGA